MKRLLLLAIFLSSCGGEVDDCDRVRVLPSDGPGYWITICTSGDNVVTIHEAIEEEAH